MTRTQPLAAIAIAVSGCAQMLGLDPTERRDAGSTGDDAAADDGAAAPDACASCPRLVARYRFEGDLDDTTGAHHGSAIGSGLTYVADRDGSGQALLIPTTLTSYVRVADAAAFDIAAGTIELWFHVGPAAPAAELGLISRDANGTTMDGHFNIRLTIDRKLVARIQRMSDPTVEAFRCTSGAISGGWHHVEAVFGPGGFTVRLDDAAVDGTMWTNSSGTVLSCTAPWDRGIAGNANPWAIGALTVTATEGTGLPATAIAGDVTIDDVAIWELAP